MGDRLSDVDPTQCPTLTSGVFNGDPWVNADLVTHILLS